MAMLASNPNALILALIGGIIPALFWLWFWLREDKEKPEPKGVLLMCFLIGMACVIFILPIEKLIQSSTSSSEWQIVGWASVEEIVKYFAMMIILFRTKFIDQPIDWPIYMITTALGFAALENAMFLIKPILLDQTTVSLLTGQLRFLGSTLLHAVSSGIVGIALGLSFHMEKFNKRLYLLIGLIFAIILHSAFNFSIIKNSGGDFLKVFAFLWVATIINLLLFEKLRRMSNTEKVVQ